MDGILPQSSANTYLPPHLMVNHILIVWDPDTLALGWDPMHVWALRIQKKQLGSDTWEHFHVELPDWVQSFTQAQFMACKICSGQYCVRRHLPYAPAFEPSFEELGPLALGDSIKIL